MSTDTRQGRAVNNRRSDLMPEPSMIAGSGLGEEREAI